MELRLDVIFVIMIADTDNGNCSMNTQGHSTLQNYRPPWCAPKKFVNPWVILIPTFNYFIKTMKTRINKNRPINIPE